jgi:hypothetical protein
MDIADGKDKNAFLPVTASCCRRLKNGLAGGDIYASVAKAFGFCDDFGIDEFRFDEDGLGAGAVVMHG